MLDIRNNSSEISMVNDAYVEDNKTKKQAWLMIPLAIIVIGIIMLFGNREDNPLQPKVISSSTQGMLLGLPILSESSPVNWTLELTPTSSAARQRVSQSLSQYSADYKQLRSLLEVWAKPGSPTRQELARRIGGALAQHNLGQINQGTNPPARFATLDRGALLICAESDSGLAKRMLSALTPYLGGSINLRFDSEVTPQTMHLYLFGTPYFSDQGQATFDDVALK